MPAVSSLRPHQVRGDSPYPFSALAHIGTSSNPYTVLDSEDDADFPTGPNPSNDDLFTVSDHEMEAAVTDASTIALAEAVEEAIEGGANGNPPDYTEPSYRQRLDDTLGAFSVMPADRRRVWSQYFRRFLTAEIAQEVETRTCNLRARNDTLTSDTLVLRQLLAKVGGGSTRLNMDPRSQWTKTKFRKSDFKEMPPRKIRVLAQQLLKAANGNASHPIIRRITVCSACIDRFNSQ